MKNRLFAIAAAAAFTFASASAQTLAFTGFNADGLDNLAFVALAPIAGGSTIFFTDNEWNGSAIGSGGAFNSGESGFSWTAPVSGISVGSIVLFNDINSASTSANLGTISYHDGANKGVSTDNESIYAYLGGAYAPTSFLAVVANDLPASAGSVTNLGTGAIVTSVAGDEDIMAYIGPRSGLTSFAAYIPFLTNSANWVTQDASGDQHLDGITPDVPFSTQPFTIIPEPSTYAALFGLAALCVVGWHRRRQR